MSTTLRWGLLGTARINRRLIPAIRTVRRSELVAVASREAERAHAYAAEWNISSVHSSYDALLRDRSVDAVYIPLPNALHVPWTLRALDAGKHVLCEKPLALAADDVDRIAAVARARSLVVAEGFMYRHQPLIAHVVELLEGGAIGSVRIISAGFTYTQDRTADVRLEPELGGGSLWDIGCYAVNAARLIAGTEPISVTGIATMNASGVDDTFSGVLRFPDITATVLSSFRATYRNWLEVVGSDGVLQVENLFRPSSTEAIDVRRGNTVRRIDVEGSTDLFVRQIDDFVGATLDGRAQTVSLADSRGNAAALAALATSARTARQVTL